MPDRNTSKTPGGADREDSAADQDSTRRPTFSIVVTAPKGIACCLLPAWLIAKADGVRIEIIVADGIADAPNRSTAGLKHLDFAGDHVFALRRKGLLHARNDWVVLLEDHAAPFPDFLDEFEKAIASHPEADLISGAAVNETSTTPASWSHFLTTAYMFWPPSRRNPRGASITLLAIRRTALAGWEMEHDGGFEIRLLRRIVRSGRHVHCETALANHIQENTLFAHCAAQFHNARCHSVFQRQLGRSRMASLVTESIWFVYATTIRPLRVMRDIHRTPQFQISHLPRLIVLGLAMGLGRLRGLWGNVGQSPYALD